jgi:hypothetical protein
LKHFASLRLPEKLSLSRRNNNATLRKLPSIILATVEWGKKWNILLLTICLLIGWNYRLPWLSFYSPFGWEGMPSVDFHTFYLAGKSWLLQANPYVSPSRGFVYPPTSLPFFGIFTLFDFKFASQLWWVTYLSLFVVALLAFALTLKGDRKYVYLSLAVLLFLTSYPLLDIMQFGQIDLLISDLSVLSLLCERLKHRSVSAVMLSIATLLKGPALLLLIYFVLFRRDLQYLAQFLVSTLMIVGASLLIIPIGLYEYYIVNVLPTLSIALASDWNQSLTGLITLAHMSQITPVVSVAGFVLFGIFSFWVSSKKLASGSKSLRVDAMFLMNVLVMLLFGPRSTIYPYAWVILPLALFLSALLMEQVKLTYLALVVFATFLLNSVLAPDFLRSTASAVVAPHFINYQVLFPSELVGNLILIISLIPIYLHPRTIFRHVKTVQ